MNAEEAKKSRGRLKVFLGASAGVGKTYAMLVEAHEQKVRSIDVLVGYAECHGRQDTDSLLNGLEILPRKELNHRSLKLTEFDLDGALKRRPQLILVDELAHTNVSGSRHPKRYQDVEELLQAGIDVYTTVNIQHLESLNDVVAQITGVVVRETIPDFVLEIADEIEVIDIPPGELRQRLREGKVYVPDRIEKALDGFFREGNLIALRELALRRAADRVDAQMQTYRSKQSVLGVWPTKERIVVCIAPNRLGLRVVRAAARIGTASHAELIAITVESDRQSNRSPEELHQSQEALRLAERLGMHTVTTGGHDIVGEILRIAHERNATLIVVGKPIKPRWRELMQGSVVDDLVRRSGAIDVHVITGDEPGTQRVRRVNRPVPLEWRGSIATLVATGIATGLCFALRPHLVPANIIMVFLGGVALIASRYGPREAVLASLLSVAAFDFFFVPPFLTFSVEDSQYLLTFAIMLLVALLISGLAIRLRQQAMLWQTREERSAALYRLSRDLAKTRTTREVAEIASREIGEQLHADVSVLLKGEGSDLGVVVKSRSNFEFRPNEQGAANWVVTKGEVAGAGTDTLPNSEALYVPLVAARGIIGVLGIKADPMLDPQQESLLLTFANGIALAFERTLLAKESQVARLAAEAEKLRNVLLNSVSHDLRTPLTVIHGAASSIAEKGGSTKEMADTIVTQAERMNRHVQNLLDMTRLEADAVEPKMEWNSVEELLGSALQDTDHALRGRSVKTFIPADMALVKLDGILMTKALVNLLENAARHTPEGTEVEVHVSVPPGKLLIRVADRGPGIAAGEEERIFDKFYQPEAGKADRGFGLGLAICKAVAEAHRGKVWAENREGGGAIFFLEISASERAPEVPID